MNDRVLVIVPTRDRPKQLAELVRTVLNTSQNADVVAYVDEDQALLYQWTNSPPSRMLVERGPRIGPVASANLLAKLHIEDYAAFGFVPDDARFTVPCWDTVVLGRCVGEVACVAPSHSSADVDMPFVSRRWFERLGWLAWPGLYHWGWPSIIGALALATDTLYKASPDEFWIDHEGQDSKNRERYPADIVALYDYFACHFERSLRHLRGTDAQNLAA